MYKILFWGKIITFSLIFRRLWCKMCARCVDYSALAKNTVVWFIFCPG